MDQQAEKDKTERVTGLGRTREEIAKWNQMTALRFQTGGRHSTSPASLRGTLWGCTDRALGSTSRGLVYFARLRGRSYPSADERSMAWVSNRYCLVPLNIIATNWALARRKIYGVVPKWLLTFLGSLYKEVAKTTSGTLVYRFERQTHRKKPSFEKHCVLDLECRILSQEPSDSCILYFNVILHGK